MSPILGQHLPARPGRRVATIALPVGFEFILVLGLTFVNQIIVGGLGDVAVAAVGFANSVNMIPLFFLGALNIGAGVVVARAFGGGHKDVVSKSVTYGVLVALVTGLLVATPFVLFPSTILGLVGASPEVIAQGSAYLAVTLAGLAAGVLGMVLSGVLRSVSRPRSPMVATIITIALSTPLAVVLVYGLGPIPALGVVGAAWALLITTVLKVVILMLQIFVVFDVADWILPRSLTEWVTIGRPIIKIAAPMAMTSISWTSANFLYNVMVQQLGDGPLAVLQIVGTMAAVFIAGSFGLASAISVLVGQSIGAGNPELAKAWSIYVMRLGIATSVILGGLFALSALALPLLFPNVSSEVLGLTAVGIVINAAFQPLTVRMLLLAAVLPNGNDTTGIIIGDFTGPYLVGLPLSLFLAFFTPLGVLGVLVGRGVEDTVKMLVFGFRARRIAWEKVMRTHQDSLMTPGDIRTGPITL
jgi:putative MATE family efflux protein